MHGIHVCGFVRAFRVRKFGVVESSGEICRTSEGRLEGVGGKTKSARLPTLTSFGHWHVMHAACGPYIGKSSLAFSILPDYTECPI